MDLTDRRRGLIRIPTVSNYIEGLPERQCFFRASRDVKFAPPRIQAGAVSFSMSKGKKGVEIRDSRTSDEPWNGRPVFNSRFLNFVSHISPSVRALEKETALEYRKSGRQRPRGPLCWLD